MTRNDYGLDGILDLLHDSIADPALWPRALAAIADRARTDEAALCCADPEGGRSTIVASQGWPEDPAGRACAEVRLRGIIRNAQRAPRPQERAAGIPVCDDRERVAIGLVHDGIVVGAFELGSRAGELPQQGLSLAKLLAPHLSRTIVAAQRFSALSTEAEICRGGLDRLGHAILLLETDGRILYSNVVAERALLKRDPLGRSGDRLVGTTPEAADIVRRILRAPCGTPQEDTVADANGVSYAFSWVALTHADDAGAPSRRLLVVRGSEQRDGCVASLAARRYGLTAAEQRVLSRIITGDTVAEAAVDLGVCASTVKTHLAAIFRKSSTHRRVDLVRHTLSLDSRLVA